MQLVQKVQKLVKSYAKKINSQDDNLILEGYQLAKMFFKGYGVNRDLQSSVNIINNILSKIHENKLTCVLYLTKELYVKKLLKNLKAHSFRFEHHLFLLFK